MKSELLYNRLICVDALLSFDGIIPSLPDLHLKLSNFIELFSKALISEGENEQLSDSLCYLLCCYLDRQIALCLSADKIAWDRYSLTHQFYGYQSETEKLSAQLESLLANGKGQVFICARKLLLLVAASSGGDQSLDKLLSRYAPPPVVRQPAAGETTKALPSPQPPARLELPWRFILPGLLLIVLWLFCLSYLDAL